MNWGWPQFVMAALYAVNIGFCLAKHGQPKRDTYDLTDAFIAPGILRWLMYMGGFWTPAP